MSLQRLLRCWGKTERHEKGQAVRPEIFHPALYHMIDVGNVAAELVGEYASPRWRKVLARVFSTEPETLKDWIPFLVAAHDIGKISADFQGMVPEQKRRLEQEGFVFGRSNGMLHTLTGQIFTFFKMSDSDMPKALRLILRDVTGGHHGRFLQPNPRESYAIIQRDEPPIWAELRLMALDQLRPIFWKVFPENWSQAANRSGAIMALTGFTVICDWIGSDERFFHCQPDVELSAYLEFSRQRAREAVTQAGFMQTIASQTPILFQDLFPNLPTVRPLQAAIDAIPDEVLVSPFLAIIEAPTGEGKTEAALALAHRSAMVQGKGGALASDEMYFALPTTATSNQIYARVQKYLREQLSIGTHVKLIHSQAFLLEDDLPIEPMEGGETAQDSACETLEWFGPKKRALLAPFGVGTIDQAELGALNTRYNALRLIGLAGKVLLLDEVHAYDTYMTTITARLLEWLAAMGTTVILLSATLPQEQRSILLKAYTGKEMPDDGQLSAYPSLIIAGEQGHYSVSPQAAQTDRRLGLKVLEFGSDDAEGKAAWLVNQAKEGGCACWITNTVDRAQRIFEAVERMVPGNVECTLIHSRFPMVDRQRLEEVLKEKFGPDGNRPERAIVVGTQVLEQSLDLDFDVMASDLAPVDFLLQRAGRMHRHDRVRPSSHARAELYIAICRQADGDLNLYTDSVIYAEYLLRKTWQALQGKEEIWLPEGYRTLIKSVYSAAAPEPGDPLEPCWKDLRKKILDEGSQAVMRLMPAPDPQDSFCGKINRVEFEEDENRAGWIVAQTRLGEPGITVLPLEHRAEGVVCPGVEKVLDLNEGLPRALQLELLRRSIRITHREVVEALAQAAQPGLLAKSALMKGITPLWVVNNSAEILTRKGSLELRLDSKLGLVIRKKKT